MQQRRGRCSAAKRSATRLERHRQNDRIYELEAGRDDLLQECEVRRGLEELAEVELLQLRRNAGSSTDMIDEAGRLGQRILGEELLQAEQAGRHAEEQRQAVAACRHEEAMVWEWRLRMSAAATQQGFAAMRTRVGQELHAAACKEAILQGEVLLVEQQQQQMQGQLQRMLVEQRHQQMRLRRYAAAGRAEQTPTLRDRQQAWEEQAELMQEAREEAAEGLRDQVEGKGREG
jgi:hypothetical protein